MAICTRCRSYQNPITDSFGRCDECAADDAAQPTTNLTFLNQKYFSTCAG
jgi:hypothetical protein